MNEFLPLVMVAELSDLEDVGGACRLSAALPCLPLSAELLAGEEMVDIQVGICEGCAGRICRYRLLTE